MARKKTKGKKRGPKPKEEHLSLDEKRQREFSKLQEECDTLIHTMYDTGRKLTKKAVELASLHMHHDVGSFAVLRWVLGNAARFNPDDRGKITIQLDEYTTIEYEEGIL